MSKRGVNNILAREKVIFRELRLPSQETTGFVIRLLNRDVRPPQITTVAQQPGHSTITTETFYAVHDYHPQSHDLPNRFYNGLPAKPENLESVVTRLNGLAADNPVAATALQHLHSDSQT